MMDDKALREKLAKVEALFRRAASPGEKAAAGAAMDRLHGRLGSWDRLFRRLFDRRFPGLFRAVGA